MIIKSFINKNVNDRNLIDSAIKECSKISRPLELKHRIIELTNSSFSIAYRLRDDEIQIDFDDGSITFGANGINDSVFSPKYSYLRERFEKNEDESSNIIEDENKLYNFIEEFNKDIRVVLR